MLRKTATIVLSPYEGPGALRKTAHRHVFAYTPRHGYLYVRSRMISSRCNDNFDEFPADEIEKGFRSFIGKPVFVNHHNDDHRRMRGLIIDAALHRDTNADGTPDTWVEGLMEIDALRFPKLAKAIVLKQIERTSMGVDVERSRCSACGNVATTPLEYCRHVPGMKGRKYYRVEASTGRKVGQLIYESCYGLGFFENSLLVEDPADPTAYFLGDVEFGPGLDHLHAMHVKASAPALARTATLAREWPPGRPVEAVIDPRLLVEPQPIRPTSSLKLVQATRCEACRCSDTVADSAGHAECFRCGFGWHEGAKAAMLQAEAAKYDKPEDHPFFQKHPVSADNIIDHWNQATAREKDQGKRWYPDAHIIATALGEHAKKREISHPEGNTHLAAGIIANHSPQNGWAGNMHDAGRVLHEGKGLGGPGAGMFASTAQRKNDDRMLAGEPYQKVLKGPKINDFAHLIEHGGDEKKDEPHVVVDRHALGVAAGHALTDADYGSAPMSGTPRKDGTMNRRYYDHVVGKYHEAAKQISEKEGEPLAGHQVQAVTWLVRQRLNQKAERERAATGVDSRLDRGRERSRSNAETRWQSFAEEHGIAHHHAPGTGYTASLGDQNVAKPPELREAMQGVSLGQDDKGFFVYTHRARSDSYPSPHEIPKSKISFIESTGARHLAYGETKAPGKVDTLRDENCPVCGEQDAWDGNVCAVCQYVAPPKQFQDPDLTKARDLDLRQEQQDYDDSIQPAIDPETGMPMGGDVQPDLVCPNCGTEFEAGEPESTSTEDPQAGDTGVGPAEGDVCPACGQAPLENATEAAEQGTLGAPPDEDENQREDEGDLADQDAEADAQDKDVVDPRDLVDDEDPQNGSEVDEGDDPDQDGGKPAKGKFPPKKK